MVDLILTLSAWILVSATILPMAIQFMIESNNEREKHIATGVLYEKLQEILVEGDIPTHQLIIKNGKQYEFIPDPVLKEVCIQFENNIQYKQKVCEFWE